jgi:hypothetical protein
MAVFFDPKALPRSDLGLEGTPWYMAPEVMSSQVGGGWAAGSTAPAAGMACGPRQPLVHGISGGWARKWVAWLVLPA